MIEPKEVEPKIFIDYIRAANESNIFIRNNITAKAYNYYQVKTASADFDSYLANLLPDKFEYTDIIRTLKDDSNYSFTILLQTIKDCISNKKWIRTMREVYLQPIACCLLIMIYRCL